MRSRRTGTSLALSATMMLARVARRHFSVLLISGAALSAWISARGVVRIAQAAIAVDARTIAAASHPSPNPTTPTRDEKNARAIIARNPFDSVTGALVDLSSPGSPTNALQDPSSLPTCDGVKILVIAQSSDPDWSFAAMTSGEADAKSQLRRRGGDFRGKKVERIGWDRIWFSDRGSICQAPLFSSNAQTPVKNAAKPSSVDPIIAQGIHRTSATQFEIDRGVLDKILENQSELMKVRIVPEQPAGIRIFGIRADSLFALIGMENGDRIASLNGLAIDSPQQALEAYGRLRIADHVTAEINRNGSPMQIDYDIR